MIVNARMKDGRTTFQFASRKDFMSAIGQDPEQKMVRQTCWVKHNIAEEEPWHVTRVNFINKNSIAFVLNAEDMPWFGLPAKPTADERKAKFEAAEAEAGA